MNQKFYFKYQINESDEMLRVKFKKKAQIEMTALLLCLYDCKNEKIFSVWVLGPCGGKERSGCSLPLRHSQLFSSLRTGWPTAGGTYLPSTAAASAFRS